MAHTCTAPQHSAHKLLSAKSKQCGSIHNPEAAKVKTEINCSSNLPTTHLFDLQKVSPVSDAENSISHISQADFSETILSSSSTFCTSMYSTSSTNYNTCRQTSALPFLPHPPKCAQQQQHSAGQSSSSSSLLYGADLNDGDHDDTKHSDDLQDFLNLSGDASESSFHGESKSMAFNDHMEIHFLSEQLGIAMTNNEDSPRLDDIYNGPSQLSSCLVPSFSDQENPRDAGSPLKVQLSSSRAACNKPRLRWTLELHERFVEAVNKLEGPESLTIYHVKSHLQKYRFAKYLPETKGDKRYSSEDNKAKLATHGNDAGKKKSSQVAEALRMQMEVQKQLHEQLEVQRQLQLRIEEHARYLQKILEQQQKARNCSSSMRSSVEELPESTDQEKTEMKADTTSTHLSNHKISDTDMKYNTLDKNAKLQVNLEEKSLLS